MRSCKTRGCWCHTSSASWTRAGARQKARNSNVSICIIKVIYFVNRPTWVTLHCPNITLPWHYSGLFIIISLGNRPGRVARRETSFVQSLQLGTKINSIQTLYWFIHYCIWLQVNYLITLKDHKLNNVLK